MPTVKITAPDDRGVTVTARNVVTGADGKSTNVAAGETATIELDADNQAVISTSSETGEVRSTTPPTAEIEAPDTADTENLKPELREPTDGDVTTVLSLLNDQADTPRTKAGYISSDALNKALEEQGFKPVTGDIRNRLSDEGNFVKAPA